MTEKDIGSLYTISGDFAILTGFRWIEGLEGEFATFFMIAPKIKWYYVNGLMDFAVARFDGFDDIEKLA